MIYTPNARLNFVQNDFFIGKERVSIILMEYYLLTHGC